MDKDKAIRSAKLTAAGILDRRRAKTAVERAGGQIAPSKYLPGVPRQVHAAGGYVPQASIAYKALPVGQAPAIGGGTSLGDFAQMASMMGGKGEAAAPQPQHHQNDGHDHSGMSDAALQAWNKLTDAYGQPLTIVSGYRDPQQNEAAGGAKGSQHLHGNAYDIDTSGMSHEDRLALATQAYNSGFRGFGFYDNNMHFDVGDQRAWGPSHSSDSIPEWAQPFVQQYVARAAGGKVYPIADRAQWYGDANYQSTGGQIEHMSPDEYLSKVRPLDIDEASRDNIDDLKNHIMSGRKLDPLKIDAKGREDGRHRAHAAKELGIKSVPVLTWPRSARANGGPVTDNENFQSWFGNSVTHTDGEPHVFYTGTSKDKDFTAFNVGRHGVWFVHDPEVASSYADQNDSQGYKWEGGRPIKTNTASRVIPAYVKAENPYTGEYSGAVTGNYKSDQSNWFDTLRAKGHDAWIPASSQGQLAVVLREPQQIKSIYNNGKFDPNQKQMNRATGGRTVNKLNMYSKAAEVARSLPQAKGSVDQMLAMLRKGGVKPSELEHAGRPAGDMIDRETLAKHFEDALPKVSARQYGEQPRSMTQDENQEFIRLSNRHHASQYRTGAARAEPLSPEEMKRFEDLGSRMRRKDPVSVVGEDEDGGPAETVYHDYQTPGGKDYRERLLTLPKRKGTPSWTVSGPSIINPREHDTKEAADADAAQMNSRLSPDIHPSRRHRVSETTRKSNENYQSAHWSNNANVLAHIRMKDVPVDGKRALHIEEIQSDWAQEGRKQGFKPTDGSAAAKDALPNAPYVKNTAHWTDLALKNILSEAAHGRYDHVTFTGGQEQADRYGLEKSLRAIHYTPETKTLHAERIGQHRPIIQQDVAPEQVASYIGSEAANKLLDPSNAYEVGGVRRHSLVDDDLKMGGEGMKGYYDNILPKAAMKLVQQHDPSIQPSTINGNFGFTMTPKARESILQGQPAFAKGGEVDDPMVGHHNTSGRGVEVASGLGGIPMPSMAISKTAHPLDTFGDITLMAQPGMVTPSRDTNVWPTDTYTGRQPRGEEEFSDPKSVARAMKSDPNFSHMSDAASWIDSTNGVSDADETMKTAQLGLARGIDPKPHKSFYSYVNDVRQKLGSSVYDNDHMPGLRAYGDIKRVLYPKDAFTASGNRKKPVDYTLENVMRRMKGSAEAGSEGFNYGPGNFRAIHTPKFLNMGDIKSDRGLIIPKDQMKPQKSQFEDAYNALVEQLVQATGRKGFRAYDEAADALTEISKGRKYDWFGNVPPDLVSKIKELGRHASKMPTEYFEAKSKRAIPLSAFPAALVPKSDPESARRLTEAGVKKVMTYGSPEERVALYRSQPDLMFKSGGKAMALTRGFTKNGAGVMMSLKSKGK